MARKQSSATPSPLAAQTPRKRSNSVLPSSPSSSSSASSAAIASSLHAPSSSYASSSSSSSSSSSLLAAAAGGGDSRSPCSTVDCLASEVTPERLSRTGSLAAGLEMEESATPAEHHLPDNESDLGIVEDLSFSSPLQNDDANDDEEEVDPWSCDRWDSPEMLLSASTAKSKKGSIEGEEEEEEGPACLLQQRLFGSPEKNGLEKVQVQDGDDGDGDDQQLERSCFCSSSGGLLASDFFPNLVAALRQELHKDVEALASSTSSHLHSWLSEEVAFARDSITEEKKAQSAEIAVLRQEMERLQESLQQQESKWREELKLRDEEAKLGLSSTSGFKPCASITFGAPSRPNSADEARMLAEERKWRLKLEGIEDRLQHQHEHCEALQRQLDEGLAKATTQVQTSMDGWGLAANQLQDDLSSLRTLIESEGKAVRGDFRSKLESAKGEFEEQLNACRARVKALESDLGELLAGEDRIAGQMAALNDLAKSWDMDGSRFTEFKAEMTSTLADKANASDLSESVSAISTWMDEMRTELLRWSEQEQQRTSTELAGTREALSSQETIVTKLWQWCEEVRGREESLTQMLLHIVEQGSPRQLDLFEEALALPPLALD